jgi:hypothetical protein
MANMMILQDAGGNCSSSAVAAAAVAADLKSRYVGNRLSEK